MKLVTYNLNGNSRIGAYLNNDTVVDLNYAYQAQLKKQGKYRYKEIANAHIPPTMKEFIEGGKDSLNLAKEAQNFAVKNPNNFYRPLIYKVEDIMLKAPIDNPEKIFCVGHNYKEHILEMGRELPTSPVLFAKFPNTIIGPEDDIPLYPISNQLDYEAEFAFIIGKQAKNVAEDEALNYVSGYTIMNDITYRDIQKQTIQWLQGKTVDGSAPMGPWIITSDELSDPSGLDITLTVNGEERQKSNTGNLVFSVQKLISFLSNLVTLKPGDVILSGTPGGVGVARDPQVFLEDGDVVKIEVEKLGVLENKIKKFKEEFIDV